MTHAVDLAIRKMITKALTPEEAQSVFHLLRPSITLGARRWDKASDFGTCRLGGTPDLPAGEEWPLHEGRPLMFLAQINFAELASAWAEWDETPMTLPSAGMLYAFASLEDARVTRILHRPHDKLVETTYPSDLPPGARFGVASLDPRRLWSLPGYEDAVFTETAEPSGQVQGLMSTWMRSTGRFGFCGHASIKSNDYRMLGYANSVQEDVLYAMARRAGAPDSSRACVLQESRTWTMLLEIRLDDALRTTNLQSLGMGTYYWGLPTEALERGHLEAATGLFQVGS